MTRRIDSDHVQILGGRIRQLRVDAGLTQDELGERVGIKKAYVSMIETGRRDHISPDLLVRFAAALGVKTNELLAVQVNRLVAENLDALGLRGEALRFDPEDLGVDLTAIAEILDKDREHAQVLLQALHASLGGRGITQSGFLDEWLRARVVVARQHWEDLEATAAELREAGLSKAGSDEVRDVLNALAEWQKIEIHTARLPLPPGKSQRYESVTEILKSGRRHLYIDERLDEADRAVVLAREIAYTQLCSPKRSLTYPVGEALSFSQKQANYDANYLATALLFDRQTCLDGMREVLAAPTAGLAAERYARLFDGFAGLPEELLVHRLVPIFWHDLELKPVFMTCVRRSIEHWHTDFVITSRIIPTGQTAHVFNPYHHHCRFWQTIEMLSEPPGRSGDVSLRGGGWLNAQISEFHADPWGADPMGGRRVLNLTVLSPHREGRPAKTANIGLDLGDPSVRKLVVFSNDPALLPKKVGVSCETCPAYENCPRKIERIHCTPFGPSAEAQHEASMNAVKEMREWRRKGSPKGGGR